MVGQGAHFRLLRVRSSNLLQCGAAAPVQAERRILSALSRRLGAAVALQRSTMIADIRQPWHVGLVLSSILADAAENTTGKMRQLNVAARAPAYDPCPVSSQTARVAS